MLPAIDVAVVEDDRVFEIVLEAVVFDCGRVGDNCDEVALGGVGPQPLPPKGHPECGEHLHMHVVLGAHELR